MPSTLEVLDRPTGFFGEGKAIPGAEPWPARAPDPGVCTNMGAHAPQSRWRQLVRSAASVAVVASVFGLLLTWMGGAFRAKVRPSEGPPARPSAAGRTVVTVEKVRSEETVTA